MQPLAPTAVLPEPPRVLVTGAGGLLGRALCRRLAARGVPVVAAIRSRPAPPGVPALAGELPEAAGELVREARPDVVVHLAAPVDLGRDPALRASLWPGIVAATEAVARACSAAGVRLVHAGTCEEYGAIPAPMAEDDAPAPVCPYGELKLEATRRVVRRAREGRLRAVVLRPFRVYGPEARGGLVAEAAAAAVAGRPLAMSDGGQVREWNEVGAVAEGIARVALDPEAPEDGAVFNLGGGPRATAAEVALRLFALAGRDPGLVRRGARPRRPGEPAALWGDHRRYRARWGRLPDPGLEAGLARVLAAVREGAA